MFSDRLKYLRQQKAFSQKKLSEIIGFSQQSIAKWEVGSASPSPEIISKLADVFNVSTDYLLGKTDDPTPPEDRKATPEEIESGIMEVWESVGLFDPNISDAKRDLIIKLTKTILESDM